jgi:hypothetical protein
MYRWIGSDSASAMRSGSDRFVSRSEAAADTSIARSPLCGNRRAARSSSSAPPSRSLASSSAVCAAATLTSTACRQVDHGSLHASTRNVHMPVASGRMRAIQVSANSSSTSILVRRSLLSFGPRHTTVAATAS